MRISRMGTVRPSGLRDRAMSEDQDPRARQRTLTFVACISDDELLDSNLLASPCLAAGSPHEVILVRNARSAADGLNLGIERATGELIVCAHQDVFMPGTWDLQLVSGHPMLVPAAIEAVKQWRYRPYLLNGAPVEVETTITVIFTLSS